MTCIIPACGRPVRASGYCAAHYARWKRYGSPTGAPAPRPTICAVEGCGGEYYQHNYCKKHFARWNRHGDPLAGAEEKSRIKPGQKCLVPSCDKPVLQKGYCRPHYMRWYRHGDPLAGNRSRTDKRVGDNHCGKVRCPGAMRMRSRVHYGANKSDYVARAGAQPKTKLREYRRTWKATNPAKVATDRRARRAQVRNATPSWLTPEQWREMDAKYIEARERTLAEGKPYHVDHKTPLRGHDVCGLNVPWNLEVIPGAENIAKGNRHE